MTKFVCKFEHTVVCKYRQSLSSCRIGPDLSAILPRFVCKFAQICLQFGRSLSAILKARGWGRSKTLKEGAILQTNFVCKLQTKMRDSADKVCLQVADKPFQTNFVKTPPANADEVCHNCRRPRVRIALNCRQTLQTNFVYTSIGDVRAASPFAAVYFFD